MRGGEKEGTRLSNILSIEYMALVSTKLTKIKDNNQHKDNEVDTLEVLRKNCV